MENVKEKIEFDFRIEDWMAFQEYYLEISAAHQRAKKIILWSFPLVGVILTINDLIHEEKWWIAATAFGVVSIPWLIWFPGFMHKTNLKRIEKTLSDGKNASLIGPHEIEIGEEGIRHKGPQSETMINWSGIEKMATTDDYIFVFDTTVSALIIPKVAADNPLEVENFIKSKLG